MRTEFIARFLEMNEQATQAYMMTQDWYLQEMGDGGVPRYSSEEARQALLDLVLAVAGYVGEMRQEARDQGLI